MIRIAFFEFQSVNLNTVLCCLFIFFLFVFPVIDMVCYYYINC